MAALDALTAGGGPAAAARPVAPRRRRARSRVVDNGAGVILAFFAWSWVGLPLLLGGPTRVKNVLRAKFTNKAADGTWLP